MSFLTNFSNKIGPKEAVLFVIVLFVLRWMVKFITDPLRDVPGPFVARFTKLWLFRQYFNGDFHETNIQLHEKYGRIVRIAPNQYSIDDPEAAKIVYGHGTQFTKSDWYSVWGDPARHMQNLFNDQDPARHSALRRKVAAAYSMSSLVSYEPYVDANTTIFLQRMAERASAGVVFDMGHWFQCYAFEVIMQISFSERMGFLDSGEDINNLIEQIEIGNAYSACIGLYSYLHQPIFSIIQYLSNEGKGMGLVMGFVISHIETRRKAKNIPNAGPKDFISKFLEAEKENKMSDRDILNSIGANVGAGSDTTSIALSAILYNLCRNPATMRKLRQELDEASAGGRISDPITFQEAQTLPYLQATIKEGLRIHPATGFTMPRVVPRGGREMMGRFFPEGTIVGINAWVAHRNQEIFGNDARLFNPERWLDGKEASSLQDSYSFAFGQGSRTCIGKNISMLEIAKVIPQLIRHFDFELEKDDEWSCMNRWFVKPKDFNVRVSKRVV